MTLLGKVFTGLVFLLSVIFFSLAVAVNASHINQKAEANKYQQEATKAKQKNVELSTLLEGAKDELSIEQAARRSALAALQTQLAAKTKELQTQDANLANLQTAHTALVQNEQATQAELKARTDDNELLRKQLVAAVEDRNQLFQRLVDAKDQFNRLKGTHQSLETRAKELLAQNTQYREKFEVLDIKPDTLLTAPAVNGQVLAVATNGLVEVSLGRDDGMREGFTLEVQRDGQYLGRLVIKRVNDNKSVAEILTGYQKGYIRQGDRVDSKLF
ncbi:MAG: hypothetical protein KDA45_00320 [Planctomycetales bacterium]|nr:hypothetical protein [Planctomycetales bacterium]